VAIEPELEPKPEPDDKVIKCLDCGMGFILTHEDIQFYINHSYNLPKRCLGCRRRRRGTMQREGVANGA